MQTLDEYWAKRDFKKTGEPSGKGKAKRSKGPGGIFVVQKHAASRLHYDLRLEHDGVLWSWAVTRGPSLDPNEKRLSVHVEDHPLDYAGFEGIIPKGQYGAGAVILWDEGVWLPAPGYDPAEMMRKGDMKFELKGSKLNGGWHLIRMKPRPGEKTENWLLFKNKDAASRPGEDILEEAPQSVLSGLTIEDVQAGRSGSKPAAKKARGARRSKSELPGFIEPCLATLQTQPPSGDRWLHEIKLDGYRIQAHVQDGKAKLFTRKGLDWTPKFGEAIADALEGLDVEDAILDGEIVVQDERGAASFSALQQALSDKAGDRLSYYLFDLLWLNGEDLRAEPLIDRKARLLNLMPKRAGPLQFSEHFTQAGKTVFDHVCRLGMEGVVSKRVDAPYTSGRAREWLKAKCVLRSEFVVAGYLPSEKTGRGLRSLVLGYYDDGKLKPAGRVGTGFNAKSSDRLLEALGKIKTAKSALVGDAAREKGVIWVKPELVVEVEYRDRTTDNILRHSSFIGLREDKPAEEVVAEFAPEDAEDDVMDDKPAAKPTKGKAKAAKPSKAGASSTAASAVKLSSPDKLLWPKAGVTKQGLLEHYELVWPRIEKYVVNRPLSLVRAPDGVAGPRFFQKHASPGMHQAIRRMADPEDGEELLYIDSFDGLAALVQYGVVEVHIWGSKIDDVDKPDQIIFDLDPDEGLAAADVRAAALDVRERLSEIGLTSFVKTTGGKGFHVVVPLKPSAGWTAVKTFCHDFANAMESSAPDKYTATLSKKARSGRIFVDYLRNGRGATAVAPWSSRAKDKATVAVPVEWSAVEKGIAPDAFEIASAKLKAALKADDPWQNFDKARKALKA
jgi:bifunctional non-homologous end joining protein LigD